MSQKISTKEVQSFADLHIGDEVYVVLRYPSMRVPWGDCDDMINITAPLGYFKLPISELILNEYKGTFEVIIHYDLTKLPPMTYEIVKDLNNFSSATYTKDTKQRIGRDGLDFTPKEIGAELMYEREKARAVEHYTTIVNNIKYKLNKYESKIKLYKETINNLNNNINYFISE